MFKRNQIVHTASVREGREPEFIMFGRIVKKLGDDTYLVVSNGKNFEVLPSTHIKPAIGHDDNPYKGYWTRADTLYPDWKRDKYGAQCTNSIPSKLPQHQVFVRMPTLRQMKQNSAYYHLVWRKQKKTRHQTYFEKYTKNEDTPL